LLNLKIAHDVLVGLGTKPGASANKNGGAPQQFTEGAPHPAGSSVHHRASRP
jgi:hypothetical protein